MPIQEIPDALGRGGAHLAPDGASGSPSLRTLLREIRAELTGGLRARVATPVALSAYTRSGNVITANANGALTIDGVAVAVGDRVLLTAGAAGADNGVYEVTATGAAGARFVLTRADDFDETADVKAGARITVTEGTVLADTTWLLTTNDPIVVNTTALTFRREGPQRGQGTLAAGTFTVNTGIVVTASSRIFVSLAARPGTTTNIACVAVVSTTTGGPGVGAFTVEALLTTTAIDNDATGAVNWIIWD